MKSQSLNDLLNLSSIHLDQVEKDGFLYLPRDIDVNKSLEGLVFDQLVPTDQLKARRNTLSSRFGLSEFPLHTDGATQLQPPKFLILKFNGPRSTEVEFKVFDTHRYIQSTFFQENKSEFLFSVVNGSKSFITSILKNNVFRYNPCVMKPLSSESLIASANLNEINIEKSNINSFRPKNGDIVVIDNHRMLHSRGDVPEDISNNRWVERLWLY